MRISSFLTLATTIKPILAYIPSSQRASIGFHHNCLHSSKMLLSLKPTDVVKTSTTLQAEAVNTLRTPTTMADADSDDHRNQQAEHAKQVVRQYVEAFNAGNMSKLKDLLAEDAEIQGVLGKGTFDKISPIWQQLIDGYGMQLEIQELVAEGNTVAAKYIERGTFKAPAFGKEPTGKSYELVAMEFFTIEDGKILKRWGARDAMSQAKQLGLEPFN